ncbi:hypothetical protein HNQ56_003264 [Anaerotaenia torta]|uniref:hypothetical protein n=1 Tax=Anaerotaenia torta TaxID=433293 RepID=UPI003D21B708
MKEAVRIWVNREKPQLLGRQVMIYTFLLNGLKGRRIIGIIPNAEDDGFFLLIEGGRKVRLESGVIPYIWVSRLAIMILTCCCCP